MLRLADAAGLVATQSVTVSVVQNAAPPQITSTPSTTAVVRQLYLYQVGATTATGQPLVYALVPTMVGGQLIPPPAGMTIDATTGSIRFTPSDSGMFPVSIQVTDALGQTATQTYNLTVNLQAALSPPVITTQPMTVALDGVPYLQTISAEDPQAFPIVFSLSVSAIGMTIDPQTGIISWLPSGVGSIPVVVVATDSAGLNAVLGYTLTVHPDVAPSITSTPPTTATAGAPFAYEIEADGNGDTVNYSLAPTMVVGQSVPPPAGMTINSTTGLVTWNPTTANLGPQQVTIDVTSGGGLVTPQTFTLDVVPDTTPPAVAVEVSSQQADIGSTVTVQVQATDNVGVTSMSLSATIVTPGGTTTTPITLEPGTSGGTEWATFTDTTPGQITFTASASDAAGNVGTSTASLTVIDPSIVEAPTAVISSPANNATVSAPIPVVGTVSDPENALLSWSLSITPNDTGDLPSADGFGQNTATTVIATGTSPITNGTLGTLDPTLLTDGNYTLTLTDLNTGGLTASSSVNLTVSGNLKLGALNLSFTDMTVQAAGIPITITRTYSSLDANQQGDFGYGWNLSMSNTKVQVIHQNNELSGFGDYVPMEDGDRVIITLPNGTVDKFTFEAVPGTSLGGAAISYEPSFVPNAGTTDQLLVATGDNTELQAVGNGLETEYVNLATGDSYNPALPEFGGAYILQMHNGTQLTIDASTGDLSSITDMNGNTLTFTGTGIQSSSGPSVTFNYAPNGDISSITSYTGQTVSYGYDNNGNLTSFTDANGNTTQFTYLDTPAHYLSQIIDPNGNVIAAATYTTDGRVSSVTNANGQTENLTYDLSAQSQTTTDALGNPTTTYYDDNGNPIEVVNALGGVTLNTYDSLNDLLSSTQVTAEGNLTTTYTYDQFGDQLSVTNPDGTTTHTTYDQFGDPLTQTDSLGNVTYYNYDQNGNLLSTTMPGEGTTNDTYDDEGNLVTTTDPLGNTTTYAYDAVGSMISETDPNGSTTTYAYDSNGNQTGSNSNWVNPANPSDVVSLTTSMTYDQDGNAASQTDEAGNTTSMTYTADGQIATTTGANGDVAQYVYDAAGNLIETGQQVRDSSGNVQWQDTLSVYNADGNVIAQTDPFIEGTTAPITGTITTYDALGDVTQTQSVTGMVVALTGSGSEMNSVLSSPGTVVTTTTSAYDEVGREISSTDQYGHETLTTYDEDGRVVDSRTQSVDQNGNVVWLVTQTVYNAQGQIELTTDQYQGGTAQPIDATEDIYDSLGNQIESIRLQGVQVALVDPNDGQTVDPLDPGNSPVVSEITNWGTELYSTETVYNSLGQVTESTAPDGEVTQYEYNSLGQQKATIGQPVSPTIVGLSIPAGDPYNTLVSLRTETTYDAYGNTSSTTTNLFQFVVQSGTDQNGVAQYTTLQIDRSQAQTTQYEHDQFGNLIETIYPDGFATSATYDSKGNQTSTTDQMGQTTEYQYDNENNLIGVTLTAVTNPATGQPTNPSYEYNYDANGNQTSITDPNGSVTTFTYDAQGNELSRTLPLGQTETFEYDTQNRQTLAVSLEGVVTQSVYDPNTGNLAQTLLYPSLTAYNNGQGTPSETISYTYDAFGRQVQVQDTVGSGSSAVTSATTTTYDSQGNVLSVTSPQGTVSYAYDNLGRLLSTMIGPGDAPTSITDYTYNQLGQLWKVTVVEQNGVALSTPEVTSYEYNLMGALIQEDMPNEMADQYTYNEMNELVKETETGPGNTPIAEYDYTYRKDGLQAIETDDFWFQNNGQNVEVTNTINYSYDALDRLTDEAFSTTAEQILGYDSTLPSNVQQWESFNDEYFYDLDSNMVGEVTTEQGSNTTQTTTSTYDANDRLVEQVATTSGGTSGSPNTTTEYTYNDTEQTSETAISGTPSSPGTIQSSQQYQYNLQGQMSDATVTTYTGGQVSQVEQQTYGYDTNGNRVSMLDQIGPAAGSWTAQTLTEYLNDSDNQPGYSQVLQAMQTDPATGQIQQVTQYTIGLRQISQSTTPYTGGQPATPSTLYFGYDGHGSVRALVTTGAAVATASGALQIFNYDAYGNPIGFNEAQAATTLLYSGQETDSATGLQYLRARYYDPSTASFTSLDPYAGDPSTPLSYNKYLYTQGDPVNGYDPSGRDDVDDALDAILGEVVDGVGVDGGSDLVAPGLDIPEPATPIRMSWLVYYAATAQKFDAGYPNSFQDQSWKAYAQHWDAEQILNVFDPNGIGVRVNCWGMCDIVMADALIHAIGPTAFDNHYSSTVPKGINVEEGYPAWFFYKQMPLKRVAYENAASAPVGSWLYFKNFPDYADYHPNGAWVGENLIKVGPDAYWGFTGEGPTAGEVLSEKQWNEKLVDMFNSGLWPWQYRTTADFTKTNGTGYDGNATIFDINKINNDLGF